MKTKGKRKFVCEPMKCIICGYEFTPYTRKALYCSDACKQMAYRRRNAELIENKEMDYFYYDCDSNNNTNPEEWMANFMSKTSKTRLLDVSEADFTSFPIEVQDLYRENWLIERKYHANKDL